MASQGYVQQILISDRASTDNIIMVVNKAFKPIYLNNILPYFPQWYVLCVATQPHPNGGSKKGVPCLLVPTDKIDHLTLTRYLSVLSPFHNNLTTNDMDRCLNGSTVRGAGPGFKNLMYIALKPPHKDLPLSQDQDLDVDDSTNKWDDDDTQSNKVRHVHLCLKAYLICTSAIRSTVSVGNT